MRKLKPKEVKLPKIFFKHSGTHGWQMRISLQAQADGSAKPSFACPNVGQPSSKFSREGVLIAEA